ncbi:MAG: hypothetical protein ABEJ95_03190 [Candidatus Nanohalobium sp.]
MSEESLLEKLFGESAVLKVLDVLMDYPTMDYSKRDLAEVTGISESAVHENWEILEEIGAVEESREHEGTQLYRLNQDSEVVEHLFKIDQRLRNQKFAERIET